MLTPGELQLIDGLRDIDDVDVYRKLLNHVLYRLREDGPAVEPTVEDTGGPEGVLAAGTAMPFRYPESGVSGGWVYGIYYPGLRIWVAPVGRILLDGRPNQEGIEWLSFATDAVPPDGGFKSGDMVVVKATGRKGRINCVRVADRRGHVASVSAVTGEWLGEFDFGDLEPGYPRPEPPNGGFEIGDKVFVTTIKVSGEIEDFKTHSVVLRMVAHIRTDGGGLIREFVDKLEPLTPKTNEPTADEMLDWIASRNNSFCIGNTANGWNVHYSDQIGYLTRHAADFRDAICEAMKKDRP